MATYPVTSGGVTSDWEYDALRQVYRHKTTGHVLDVGAGTVWNSTTPQISVGDYYKNQLEAMLKDAISKNAEHVALRTFLKHVYPDALTQFDAAYAAQKRLGVGDASDNTKTGL